jgi:DNA-directed RNA polymerase specialized sigma24 family protein
MFAEDVELAESVSIAILTVLEALAPMERAVFVLHQVFDMPHAEIAPAAGKSKPRCDRSPFGHASMWRLGGRGSR